MAGGTNPDFQPRSAYALVDEASQVYRRFPLLFFVLAGAVVVPYDLILWLLTGVVPLQASHIGFGTATLINLAETGLVIPLISALHVHAVAEIRDENRPLIAAVARQSLGVLPTVSLVSVVSFLGATAGLILLVVPGIILWLRWAVVAQTAAMEDENWRGALRRSRILTEGHYWHVFGVAFFVFLINFGFAFFFRQYFDGVTRTLASFLVGMAVQTLLWSFSALATALLYFDLRTRLEQSPAGGPVTEGAPVESGVQPTGHPQDPASYSDEDRPPGWYVIPDKPWRMRYWAADGEPGWSRRTAKTPKATLAQWRDLRWVR